MREELASQLAPRWQGRVCLLSQGQDLRQALHPVRRALGSARLSSETSQRLLADLHRRWQAELELLRRERFQQLQRRTQWLVAGSVFASPLTSVDLLAVAVANGLMINEMAEIWGTSIKPEVLQEAAMQLARAALAQGLWSGRGRPCWVCQAGRGKLGCGRGFAGPECGLSDPGRRPFDGGLAGAECWRCRARPHGPASAGALAGGPGCRGRTPQLERFSG